MNRLPGKLLFDPGVPSMLVPYHNLNDFYFSGHLGTNTLCLSEFYINGNMSMVYFCLALAFYNFIYLTLIHDHFFIDLPAGIIIAHFAVMQADWITWPFDCKFFGLSHNKRTTYVTVPCIRCGWNNWKPRNCIDKDEWYFLKRTYKIRKIYKA